MTVQAGATLDVNSLTVVRDVPILQAGIDYRLSTGKTTFTPEDLADVVASQDDPAVSAPRLKIGHVDPRFDGEPALGKVINMRLGDAGCTIYGDYVGVPKWLAGIMASAFPNKSIEGDWDVETVTGNKWRLVVTAVSLLGVNWPGVSTLDDLPVIFSAEGPEGVTVDGVAVAAASPAVAAAANVEDVRRQYYDSLSSAESWWWIRAIYVDPAEIIVDDDEGQLYRVGYTVEGDTVSFAEPAPVKIVYQDIPQKTAASVYVEAMTEARRDKVAASYGTRDESRPSITAKEGEGMDPDVLKALGLGADASKEQMLAAIEAQKAGTATAEQPAPGQADPPAQAPPTPAQPTTPAQPEQQPDQGEQQNQQSPEQIMQLAASAGMAVVDKDTFAMLKQGAEAGIAAAKAAAEQRRDQVLASAVKDGKIPPARRDHYAKLYDADPEGTTQLLASMERGLVPVNEHGHASTDEFAEGEAYPQHWFPEVAARAAAAQGRHIPGSGAVLQERVS